MGEYYNGAKGLEIWIAFFPKIWEVRVKRHALYNSCIELIGIYSYSIAHVLDSWDKVFYDQCERSEVLFLFYTEAKNLQKTIWLMFVAVVLLTC